MKDGSIGDFCLSIRLGVSHRGKPMLYMDLDVEIFELLIVKLSAIIYDYDKGQAEPTDNELLDEASSFVFSNYGL